ncbi:MAG: hypothetical protein IJT77_06520 [Clostridia bacterium]|nr:hypothetical protein [Clostridia bacterium]
MKFNDMAELDNASFLDVFGEERTVTFDRETYEEIPCVISKMKEQDRVTVMSDHEHGLYRVTAVFHCKLSDLGDTVPEKGRRFGIYDSDDSFLREYYVAQSSCDGGMVRLELEAIDE